MAGNYIERNEGVMEVGVDERYGFRIVMYVCPLRYKQAHYVVAVEREAGNDEWVRVCDHQFHDEHEARNYWESIGKTHPPKLAGAA